MEEHDVTKMSFLKNLSTDFSEILMRRHIDAGKGAKNLVSISAAVLSYRENPAGVAESAHQQGAC